MSSDSYDDVQPLPEDFPPPPPEIRYPFIWFTEGQQEMRARDIENSVQIDNQHTVKLYWCRSDKWWDQVKECLNLPINYIYLSVVVNLRKCVQFNSIHSRGACWAADKGICEFLNQLFKPFCFYSIDPKVVKELKKKFKVKHFQITPDYLVLWQIKQSVISIAVEGNVYTLCLLLCTWIIYPRDKEKINK